MRYFLKIYGYTRSGQNSKNFDGLNELGQSFYTKNGRVFFGDKLPVHYSKGDIFIQYVPLGQKINQAGRILGYYKSTSEFKVGEVTDINSETGDKKVWNNYIEVENQNTSFSQKIRNENLLNMRIERNNIDFPKGKIISGWAYISEKDALYLIDKINSFK